MLEQADGKLFFECPGCKMLHGLNVLNGLKPDWSWNGDAEKPTFSPSVLVTYPWGPEQVEVRCHSFVEAGRIRFLNDCTHHLAGQTVDLPLLEHDW
ncbi:hypothetical protein D9M69_625310 [compost metagenome]